MMDLILGIGFRMLFFIDNINLLKDFVELIKLNY